MLRPVAPSPNSADLPNAQIRQFPMRVSFSAVVEAAEGLLAPYLVQAEQKLEVVERFPALELQAALAANYRRMNRTMKQNHHYSFHDDGGDVVREMASPKQSFAAIPAVEIARWAAVLKTQLQYYSPLALRRVNPPHTGLRLRVPLRYLQCRKGSRFLRCFELRSACLEVLSLR